jgi:hypothetical protein
VAPSQVKAVERHPRAECVLLAGAGGTEGLLGACTEQCSAHPRRRVLGASAKGVRGAPKDDKLGAPRQDAPPRRRIISSELCAASASSLSGIVAAGSATASAARPCDVYCGATAEMTDEGEAAAAVASGWVEQEACNVGGGAAAEMTAAPAPAVVVSR